MKSTYDPEADAFYLYFGSSAVSESVEVRPGIVLDFDAEGPLPGIEILDASRSLPKAVDLAGMESPGIGRKTGPC
ncbi:MAG: DUF2283 domain-containing protein [Bosea sp.]|uniref:DUF2283 domain-containing protein n=1 Tax=Bosea sp. (in: a-proteobacteria) TaxID=1871050 RepID=UPI001AC1A266|nr:DUF2283 domain-containing protein [Bosea sp. (in: a-proteobacteria)]MBN9453952.1 DUF2283 domain-containing protein [Bosea sp. (in: a-proteobacteria)]